jgi:hypothetical protein
VDNFERFFITQRLFSYQQGEAWRTIITLFPHETIEMLRGIVSMARAEHKLPREPLEGHSLREYIEILRYASEGTSLAVYNAQDTFTNNLLKISGPYIPDTIH